MENSALQKFHITVLLLDRRTINFVFLKEKNPFPWFFIAPSFIIRYKFSEKVYRVQSIWDFYFSILRRIKKQKLEVASSSFLVKLQQTTWKLKSNYPSLYYVCTMFILCFLDICKAEYLCFYVKFTVVGVNVFSISVRVVGGGRLTVVMNAILLKDVVHTEMTKKISSNWKRKNCPS